MTVVDSGVEKTTTQLARKLEDEAALKEEARKDLAAALQDTKPAKFDSDSVNTVVEVRGRQPARGKSHYGRGRPRRVTETREEVN